MDAGKSYLTVLQARARYARCAVTILIVALAGCGDSSTEPVSDMSVERYYPLVVGATWEWDTGLTETITEREIRDGTEFFTRRFAVSDGTMWDVICHYANGQAVLATNDTTTVLLSEPLLQGNNWVCGQVDDCTAEISTIHAEYSSQFGTLHDVVVVTESVESRPTWSTFYARDIGIVRRINLTAPEEEEIELVTAYSLPD